MAYGPPAEVFREDILEATYGSHLMIVKVGDRRVVVADEHRPPKAMANDAWERPTGTWRQSRAVIDVS